MLHNGMSMKPSQSVDVVCQPFSTLETHRSAAAAARTLCSGSSAHVLRQQATRTSSSLTTRCPDGASSRAGPPAPGRWHVAPGPETARRRPWRCHSWMAPCPTAPCQSPAPPYNGSRHEHGMRCRSGGQDFSVCIGQTMLIVRGMLCWPALTPGAGSAVLPASQSGRRRAASARGRHQCAALAAGSPGRRGL